MLMRFCSDFHVGLKVGCRCAIFRRGRGREPSVTSDDLGPARRPIGLVHAGEPIQHTFAAIRANALLDAGDLEGSAVWRSIAKEIEKLQADKPAPWTYLLSDHNRRDTGVCGQPMVPEPLTKTGTTLSDRIR
jgi:hypothetical protein